MNKRLDQIWKDYWQMKISFLEVLLLMQNLQDSEKLSNQEEEK